MQYVDVIRWCRHAGRFDEWAATYDKHPARFFFHWIHRVLVQTIDRAQVPTGAVVDVGCGTGELLRSLTHGFPAGRLIGIDASAAMVAVAGRKLPGRCLVAKADQVPIRDGSAAAVVTTLSFHHWDDQDESIAEIRRVLVPGGLVIIADIFVACLMAPLVGRLGHGHGTGMGTVDELKSQMIRAGLAVTSVRRVGPPTSPLRLVTADPQLGAIDPNRAPGQAVWLLLVENGRADVTGADVEPGATCWRERITKRLPDNPRRRCLGLAAPGQLDEPLYHDHSVRPVMAPAVGRRVTERERTGRWLCPLRRPGCVHRGCTYIRVRPRAGTETTLLLFEATETVNTGDTPSPLTATRTVI